MYFFEGFFIFQHFESDVGGTLSFSLHFNHISIITHGVHLISHFVRDADAGFLESLKLLAAVQRIAADVQRLRQSGMTIITRDVEVSDSLTGTTRVVSGYSL